jgi:hypothetical protein
MSLSIFFLHLRHLEHIYCMVHHSCPNISLHILLTFRSLGRYFLYGASLLPQCLSLHFLTFRSLGRYFLYGASLLPQCLSPHLGQLEDTSFMVHHSCPNIVFIFRSLGRYFLYGASLLPQCLSPHFPYI